MGGDNTDEDDPLIGAILDDRFRLEDTLGEGGMGRVYEGRQMSVDRPVAVKILREEIENSETRQRFEREARILSGLSHPNLVRLIDFGSHCGMPYLVMEKVGGVSLKQILGRGRLRLPLVLTLVRQICAGLTAIHHKGIIHRDLKPDNIHLLAAPDGMLQLRILDFGLAFADNSDERLTQTGEIQGTPQYIAPERIKSIDVDARADLYAVGVMLYEMLAGVPPFVEDTSVGILMKKVDQRPPPLAEHLTGSPVSSDISALTEQLLEPDPEDRPRSAERVRDRTRQIEERLGLDPLEVGSELSVDEAISRWVLDKSELDPMLSTADTLSLAGSELAEADTGPADASASQTNAISTASSDEEDDNSKLLILTGTLAALSWAATILLVIIYTVDPGASSDTSEENPTASPSASPESESASSHRTASAPESSPNVAPSSPDDATADTLQSNAEPSSDADTSPDTDTSPDAHPSPDVDPPSTRGSPSDSPSEPTEDGRRQPAGPSANSTRSSGDSDSEASKSSPDPSHSTRTNSETPDRTGSAAEETDESSAHPNNESRSDEPEPADQLMKMR